MAFLKKIFSARGGFASGEKKEKKEAPKAAKEKDTSGVESIISSESKAKTSKATAGVLDAAHITEKTADSGADKYAFLVNRNANKMEVGRAVEARYGVDVLSVNIINMPGKERRRGKQIGWKPGAKKAIVKVKEGQTIELT